MKDYWLRGTRNVYEGGDNWVFNFVCATSNEENAWRTRLRLESVPDTEVVLSNIRRENVN
jgi:hypothetical protein